jgi:hypothetical protein
MQKPTVDSLRVFVDNLVVEKELTNLDPEVLAQVKSDLLDRIEDRINAAIVEHVPAEKLEYFEQLVSRSDQKEIQSFCHRNIPGMDEIVAQELVAFRSTYLNLNQ